MSLDFLNGVDEVDLLNDELDLHYQRSVDDERMIEMSGYRSESGGSDGWRSEGDPKGTKEGKVSSTLVRWTSTQTEELGRLTPCL